MVDKDRVKGSAEQAKGAFRGWPAAAPIFSGFVDR